MAWTWQSALFFAAIATALVVMTALELRWPSVERRGLSGLSTTRGDRFFMSLLGSAFIHILWLALTGLPLTSAAGLVSADHLAGLQPIDDVRASAAYRRDAALTLLRDALADLASPASRRAA